MWEASSKRTSTTSFNPHTTIWVGPRISVSRSYYFIKNENRLNFALCSDHIKQPKITEFQLVLFCQKSQYS